MNISYYFARLLNCYKKVFSIKPDSTMGQNLINYEYLSIDELEAFLGDLVSDVYRLHANTLSPGINQLQHLLRSDISCYIEYPYVEKVYRDSYYNYYSTKHNSTIRNCVRVSFFINKIGYADFRNPASFKNIQDCFLGFITIRPTLPNFIGRTMLSPSAYKNNIGLYCLTETNVLVNGIKLNIRAFPHSSQDGETITCAETTIWSVMEYFGTRYHEYLPTLPSKIISTLSNYSYERQIPSRGLTSEQISYAIREFGFGSRLYAIKKENTNESNNDQAFPKKEFKRLFGYYIESGIPLIAAVENDTLGHAMVVMGRESIDHHSVNLLGCEYETIESLSGPFNLYDYADLIDNYFVIDDNFPPYNKISFDQPTQNYEDRRFNGCTIQNFIAPLYKKVYLEAGGARELIISYLENFDHGIAGGKVILKLFLTSCRSFKAELNERIDIETDAKEILLSLTMPKFIWIGLLSEPGSFMQSKANGLIVLDATETNMNDAFMVMVSPKCIVIYDSQAEPDMKHSKIDITIDNFNIFANNLKGS
jgi:hypothetical protein